MGRGRGRTWTFKWCSFFASVALFAITKGETTTLPSSTADHETNGSGDQKLPPETEKVHEKTHCGKSIGNRFLLLVSTLDGKVSALNLENEGQIEWSINTGSGDMLSSSISKLEVNRDGKKTRLIPSLDGGLYQYDGESVEPVPFNADTLLSSSFRLNDNSIVVGGKETETYGIDAKSGKVKYICDINGCEIFNKDENKVQESDETLVITRNTKTVRAVAMTSGSEKWNFSVGQHEIAYITSAKNEPQAEHALTDESNQAEKVAEDEEVIIEPCMDEDYYSESESMFNFPWWNSNTGIDPNDIDLKVIVPSGLVIAMSKSNPNQVLWQHKFKTPIANAWNLFDGKLAELDLFDATNIPALSMDHDATVGAESGECEGIGDAPALYVGSHEKQFYVQPSVRMMQQVEQQINNAVYKMEYPLIDMPHVKWKPYIATAPSRTPAEISHPLQITWENGVPYDENSVAIWKEYPYDVGYYLFPDFTPMKLNPSTGQNDNVSEYGNGDFYFDVPIQSIGYWWKEVLAITAVLAVLINVCIMKVLRPKLGIVNNMNNDKVTTESSTSETTKEVEDRSEGSVGSDKSVTDIVNFQSRYYNDFEQVSVLGKGGFGVVFQTRNRLDDCDYAVKRITLQNSDKAREKVMREVKALAKLDHSGIVRYYQAWMETPPAGWQEEKDLVDLADMSFSPTPGYIVTEYTPSPNEKDLKQRTRRRKKSENKAPSSFNPLQPFGGDNTCDSELMFSGDGDSDFSNTYQFKRNGSTEPFSPHTDFDIEEDESGSFCFGIGSQEKLAYTDESFEVLFSDKLNSTSRNASTPFKQYSKDSTNHSKSHVDKTKQAKLIKDVSFDIVFEDSGCIEKSLDETNPVDHGHAVIDVSLTSNTTGTIDTPSTSPSGSQNNQTIFSPIATRPNSLDLMRGGDDGHKGDEQTVGKRMPPPKLYLYIQMQLCRKESLKEWLASSTHNHDRVLYLDIFEQIVGAVAYVHESGLMHRDLKPSNIFFSLDGTVKIGDFGLVTALEECGEMSEAMDIVRTPASVYFRKHTDQVGTKLYMSPEQIDGKNYTHKVDIYALGLICFELLYPFSTQMERVKTLLEVKRLLFPRKFQKEQPDQCNFVKTMLFPMPEDRPSAYDILNHSLIRNIPEVRPISRVRSTSRCRTCSQSSKDSNPSFGEAGCH